MILSCSAWILAAATAAPVTTQTLKVDFNDKVDFGAFHSYAWKDTQEPTASPLNHQHITRAVERELEAKGLVKAGAGKPDVVVRYFGKIDKRTRGAGRSEETGLQPADRRTVVEFSRVEEVKLILELYTPAGLEPAWSAVATDALAPPDRLEQQIDDAIARMLEAYPPKRR
jgi:uncharacterized protein DUF4136